MRSTLKSIVARIMKPGLATVHERLDVLGPAYGRLTRRLEGVEAGAARAADRLAAVERALESASGLPLPRAKYEQELAFWTNLARSDECVARHGAPFHELFARWQSDRLRELADAMGLGLDGFAAWARQASAVEIGGGPFPALAALELVAPGSAWKRAAAVDPLALAFVREGLSPPACERIVMIEALGERVPLPSAAADLVIIENCLDHVTDPGRVLAECRRLLSASGRLWLLVDLSEHRDAMHPHAFDAPRARELLRVAGFEVLHERASAHKSHPKALGELRVLARIAP